MSDKEQDGFRNLRQIGSMGVYDRDSDIVHPVEMYRLGFETSKRRQLPALGLIGRRTADQQVRLKVV